MRVIFRKCDTLINVNVHVSVLGSLISNVNCFSIKFHSTGPNLIRPHHVSLCKIKPFHYSNTLKTPSKKYITGLGLYPSYIQIISCANYNLYRFESNLNLNTNQRSHTIDHRRNKSKKTQKRPEYDSASDSEDETEEPEGGMKLVNFRTQSVRMDGILKKALGVSRNKVETAFYEGNIRVNGKKPDKKSFQLRIGDEVDLVRGLSPMNPEFLSVSRVEMVSVKPDSESDDSLVVKVRRAKTMYIENYQTYPWKKSSTAD